MKIDFRAYVLILSSFIFCFLFISCNRLTEENEQELKGKFINQTYLSQIPDSIAGLVNAYCYELNFISSDSVKIFNGFEENTLGYKKIGFHYLLLKALQDKDMRFEINKDKTITLSDSTWNESHENSTFTKSADTNNEWDFENYVNQKMISGTYDLYKNKEQTPQKVVFSNDGKVTGLENFTSYHLCYSGDCVGETYPISNNITFTNAENGNAVYAFNIDRKNKVFKIFNIEPVLPDTKGERAIKELAFELRLQL